MKFSILDYLDEASLKYGSKIAVYDGELEFTYRDLAYASKLLASRIIIELGRENPYLDRRPIGIFMDKSSLTLASFYASMMLGAPYSLINPAFPDQRIEAIKNLLEAEVIISNRENFDRAKSLFKDHVIIVIEDVLDIEYTKANKKISQDVDLDASFLLEIRNKLIDTNPLYINFTSGSTGNPKGIAISHRSVIDFIGNFVEIFNIKGDDVIANQAPFDFDVSVKDIYSALFTGARLLIVPRSLFSKPTNLMDYICENKATCLIWAVSALCLISSFHAFDYKKPEDINKVIFSGEVMPKKHLDIWRKNLPKADFVNVYGPTEITCNCTYHKLDKNRDYQDYIPIGKHFPNEEVFLLDEDDKIILEKEKKGEICVRGSSLALGYYNNFDQTKKSFVQNPLNDFYPDLIYRTGDLGKYDENKDLVFLGRKDFQIKYQGHRIELEEIEAVMSRIDGVDRCVTSFDERKAKLKAYYLGSIEKKTLFEKIRKVLPAYMVPSTIKRVGNLPLNKNGKIDRKNLDGLAEV